MSSGQEVGSIFGEGNGYATALLRSPTVIIASIALWGMNVCLFRLFGIDYAYVLMLDVNKEKEEQQKKKLKENKSDEIQNVDTDDSDDEMLPINIDDAVGTPKRNPYLEITEIKLLAFASVLILTLYLTSFVYIQVMAGSTIGAIFMFYFLVLVGVLLPLPSTAWIRFASSTVFLRAWELVKPRCTCITGRPRPVPFVDVFFADAMCSMSKVFFDWGMLWILASHYPSPVPPSLETIIVPSCFAAMPYLIRARQCLIMYNVGVKKNCPKRYQHILNALKYSSSLFPLIVSAYMKTVGGERNAVQLEKILIALMIINATYCLIWDIVMDWGMLDNPSAVASQSVGTCIPKFSGPEYKKVSCLDAALRPRLRFGTPLTVVVVLIDICLRYAWTLRFVEHAIFPSNDAYILCTEFLEVFRRAVWNLLRVEWEHIKQSRAAKKNSPMRKSSTAVEENIEMIERKAELTPNAGVSIRNTASADRAHKSHA